MEKIMLVLDNEDDQAFLEKVLERLKYKVISMKKGRDLSEQLIDHFPDLVFASTLGKNEKILSALGKIKKVRGKPKLVFVKQEKESGRLSEEQRRIIDGVLYSPVDPFKLIDVLSNTTEVDIKELRLRYNETLAPVKPNVTPGGAGHSAPEEGTPGYTRVGGKVQGYGNTQVVSGARKSENMEIVSGKVGGKEVVHVKGEAKAGEAYWEKEKEGNHDLDTYHLPEEEDLQKKGGEYGGAERGDGQVQDSDEARSEPIQGASVSDSESRPEAAVAKEGASSLIHDPERAKKYSEWTERLKASGKTPTPIDVQVLREKQAAQFAEVQEDGTIKKNRKHFLKTLFTMEPKSSKKSS